MNESTIDFPKQSLCPDIWEKVIDAESINETWRPVECIRAGLLRIAKKIAEYTKLPYDKLDIHITGSITSNSYTENADIDLHFQFVEGFAIREFAEMTQQRFKQAVDELKKQCPGVFTIKKHPIEIYFQPNKFQDFMSVGCYDLKQNCWLVGPELTDMSFNPYSEYYAEIQSKAECLAKDIRNTIFSTYELAIVYKKNLQHNAENLGQYRAELANKLADAVTLYNNIRNMRKVYSTPTSMEEALKFRSSRKWKIADAAFKLFDKYGYMAILKEFTQLNSLIQVQAGIEFEIVDGILSTVKNYINNADKLSEVEDENIDEAVSGSKFISLASIIAALTIPNILPAQNIKQEIKQLPKSELRQNSQQFQKAIKKAGTTKMIGKFSEVNTVNIVAWTIYCEAGGESLEGKKAVGSVILNRAGGDPEKLVPIVLARKQFSGWNPNNPWKLVVPTSDKDWKYRIPNVSGKYLNRWQECVDIAQQLVDKKFKSTIGNRNSYMNKATADKANVNSWGKLLDLKIGKHDFGYQKHYDGYKTNKDSIAKTKIHTIKSGDTLWSLAKKYNTTVKDLAAKNNIDVKSTLKIGQKIKV